MATRRYPGVQPFGDDEVQRKLFHGRDDEAYELLHLVLAERLVLLFARSGIGKSSLINAGLLQPLRDRGHIPMVVRVSGAAGGPVPSLYEGIRAATEDAAKRWQIAAEPDAAAWNRSSLWHFFKTTSFWRGHKMLRPVLIIDQFEELFTLYTAAERRPFIDQLADLVRGTRPRETGTQDGSTVSDAAPEVKVVLALREDFYAQLEELRPRIPAVYKAPFRLEPLSRDKARPAIVEPAGLQGEDFAVPPFSWSDDAVGQVLDFLSEQQLGEGKTQVGDEVEPFQLQLVCQHVELLVGARKLETITAADLGGDDALTRVLRSFYEDSLTTICARHSDQADLRPRLEKLCEYGFITARGRRLLREESTIMEEDGVSVEILRDLVELRLLRKEPRVGDNYYELTHDTLIDPIKLSRHDREEREARERAEQQAAVAKAQAERERRLRGHRRLAAGIALLFLIAGGAAWFQADAEAQRQEQAALAAEAEAQAAQAREAEQKQAALAAEAEAARQETVAREAEEQAQTAQVQARNAEDRATKTQMVAQKATLIAEGANAARNVVAINVELAKLQQQQIEARQQVEEAENIAAGGDAEARNQLEQARNRLATIEQQAKDLTARLEDAEKTVAVVEVQVGATQAEPNAEGEAAVASAAPDPLPTDLATKATEGVAQQLVEVKEDLAAMEAEAAATMAQAPPASQGVVAQPIAARREVPELLTDTSAEANAAADPANKHAAAEHAAEVRAAEERSAAEQAAANEFEKFLRTYEAASLCEQFDQLANFTPDRGFGRQAEFQLTQQQRLAQQGDGAPIVVTPANLVAGSRQSDRCDPGPPSAPRTTEVGDICLYAWITAPGAASVGFEVIKPDGTSRRTRTSNVERNRLRGERLGYRSWTWMTLTEPGKHTLRLQDRGGGEDRLLCETTFEVTG